MSEGLGPTTLADRRLLGGAYGVREAGRRMSNFRWLELELLELMAGWSEAILYPALRVGFGRQMFTQAVHCRELAWALANLKRAKQQTTAPSDDFVRLCERVWSAETPLHRLVGLYRVLKPHLLAAELEHAERTDPIGDAFSVRVLHACAGDHQRDIAWGNAQIERLAATQALRRDALAWQAKLEGELAESGGVTASGAPAWWLPYVDERDERDAETQAARAELAGAGELRGAGYSYRKVAPERLLPGGRQPFPAPLRYAHEAGEDAPPDAAAGTGTPEGLRYAVHQLWLGESRTVDRCGRFIVDFPDMPFGLRFDMAQQAWEEARHMEIDGRIVELLGGRMGMYPFATPPIWRDTAGEPNPFVRLLRGHVVFESSAAAATNRWLAEADGWASAAVREGLEHLSADERVHIAFGNDWTLRLIGDQPDQLAAAVDETVRQLEAGFPALYSEWSEKLPRRYLARSA